MCKGRWIAQQDGGIVSSVGTGAIDVPKSSLDKTYVYEYNSNGNIVCAKTYDYTEGELGTVKSQKSYTYSATHPDRLIDCDGTSITYNAIGCPTTYDGYTTSWDRGKLSSLTRGSGLSITDRYTFSYNALGQRIQKKYVHPMLSLGNAAVMKGDLIGCIKDYCYDESGRLISEHILSQYYQEGDGVDDLVYLYDADTIIGVVHTSVPGATNTYYFERNLLGDVIAIYDTSGNRVSAYAYDAWGNCKIAENSQRIATLNPIRYRGYYYDQDTKLYYLNARYYCPEWRRFISPDDTSYLDAESVNGLSLYAYCGNDPINYVDPTGYAFISVLIGLGIAASIGATIGAAAYATGQLVDYAITGDFEWSWGGFFGSTIGGAIGGAITFATSGIGAYATVVGAFLSGATMTSSTMIGENIIGDASHSLGDIVVNSLISGCVSMASVGIMSKIKIPTFNVGRGSASAVSKQVYTKFRRQIIRRISVKTYTKMLAVEAYNSAAGNIIGLAYSLSGARDYILSFI